MNFSCDADLIHSFIHSRVVILVIYFLHTGVEEQTAAALIILPLVVKGGLSSRGLVKVSALHSADCFILRAASLSAAEEIIQRRFGQEEQREQSDESTSNPEKQSRKEGEQQKRGRESVKKSGGTIQPLILAIGGDGVAWDSVDNYYVYINKPLFSFGNLIDAVDVCFKTIFAFNFEYTPECAATWKVIQHLFYNLFLPKEVTLPVAERCIQKLIRLESEHSQ